jgi:hypothetical protein
MPRSGLRQQSELFCQRTKEKYQRNHKQREGRSKRNVPASPYETQYPGNPREIHTKLGPSVACAKRRKWVPLVAEEIKALKVGDELWILAPGSKPT